MTLVPRNSIFDMSDFFESPWSSFRLGDTATLQSPRVDVKEKGETLEISAELPGVKKEDINIMLDNGVLTLEAESNVEKTEEEEGRIIRQERRYGKYSRSFDLGEKLQESDITAKFEDGVLTIRAPRDEKQVSHVKRIEIH
ncbi:Hsp20/alpha crystallin family protein [Teredinibacter haidensis]|uniref:Hsp20/alpha crystallin family protein n=1 Tax=Teredinibacter haidensis TaxID=2731755 RepID=UPI0009490295|nr:Hsp20/alpha crystallin family protein [Teredinibacter haidensis]